MIYRVVIGIVLFTYVASGFSRTDQDQTPRPTFRTEANYIRVDVFPTKDGAPVSDLTQADFEILDQGTPQKVEQFEHVVMRGNLPQETRIEPNTVREMRSMVENSRSRVFVLFLDTYHVDVAASHRIRQPLIEALDRMIGPDDLVGVMTPEMSPTDIAFARKTTTIAGMLTRYWYWGERDRLIPPDPDDEAYETCYPQVPAFDQCADQNGVAAEMIARRHEKRTIDALEDLVRFLRGVREERKAVITISNGWLEYRPNTNLARPLACHGAPNQAPIGFDPRTGKLTGKDSNPVGASEAKCGIDRMNLSQIDNADEFRRILDEANAANTSFYPVDPRGLAAFDTPISNPAPLAVDANMLQHRITTLRTLAEATDGLAIVNSNDLERGFKQIVADLSSYYLLGYYSTTKLDGRFHSITVRVKRPGIQVRARRGYFAATPTAAPSKTAPSPEAAKAEAEGAAVTAAIGPLAGYTREVPFRAQAAVGWKPGDQPTAFVAVEGELSAAREFEELWKGGATASIELAPAEGPALASSRVTIPLGSRTFRVALSPTQPLAPGEYIVRIGARSTDATLPTRDTLHLTIPSQPQAVGAIWIRRGPATGNKEVPTADLRFRRSERAKVEIPTLATDAGAARLLDRTGKVLSVPVTTTIRSDADGTRWATGEVTLAPLAVGDYVIELSEGNNRMLAAFRLIP